MSYSIIAAIGKNNELGIDNHLIWRLPNDLKFFKQVTNGKTIVMGRKTFESLPRMLPNRHHVVLSSSNDFPEGVEVFNDLPSLLASLDKRDEEIFIIGGASVYRLFIDHADNMYLTLVDAECPSADAYYPEFNPDDWNREVLGENEDGGIPYKHVLFQRKNRG